MKEKFLNHYMKIGPRRFVVGTVILLIILDILNGTYLKISTVINNLPDRIILLFLQYSKISPKDFDQATLTEMAGLVTMSIDFLLFVIMLNNLFFYFFYLRKKLWAQAYILFYTLTAGLFSLTVIYDNQNMGPGWLVYNLLTIPVYLYLYYGVKLLKSETTLEPKKKGR